ncbi:olfactory receptor 52E4-like [Xenopus laevis]|uniref:Olfactory receptor n=1 Tax=Xenopus laevis TaxID=8355 RepID=A0A8J1M6H0_XENLA|nr:olfactory receptor 52E4-like [Xenopus laevis]
MLNVTYSNPTALTLGFGELTSMKYLYSILVLGGFVIVVTLNVVVVAVIWLNRSLHKSMYIFICMLCFNGLYGSVAFFPSLFVNLFWKTPTISYAGCLIQVFCLNTYTGYELSILTIMAFDRYVCICFPLRYKAIMSIPNVLRLISAACLAVVLPFTVHYILTLRLPLCDSAIVKIYCDNWSVVRLSCTDTSWNQISGLVLTVGFLVVMPALILFSYAMILRACTKSSKQIRAKALQTCSPHLITITNFIADRLFEVILHRITLNNVPYWLMIFMSVYVYVVPPLLNPLIYGLKLKDVRAKIIWLIYQ